MSLFEELKRRNVFRVAVLYAVSAWLVLQVADVLAGLFGLPDWSLRFVGFILLLGFPLALIFSWVFELTPEGLVREAEVQRDDSITARTANKLDKAVIGLLVVAIGLFAADRFMGPRSEGVAGQGAQPETVSEPVEQPQQGAEPVDRSVAVLPFSTRSRNEDDVFFSEGVHDDLLTQLAKIGDLRVISRTSVMEYKNTTKRIPDIARELGVGAIVEGAVQRSGEMVRITAQLIDADSDEHLWADTFDRELTASTLFAIQTEIATQIATALKATLSPEVRDRLNRRLTDNLEALEAYQRAKRLLTLFETGTFGVATAELQTALQLDPGFAAAHALMGRAYLWNYWNFVADRNLLVQARAAIDRAREISPDLPEVDIAEGFYHYWGFMNYEAALAVLEPALEAYPNDVDLLEVVAWVNRRYGDFEAAKDYMRKAVELDPRQMSPLGSLAETHAALGEYEQAEAVLTRMVALDPDDGRTLDTQASLAFWRDRNPVAAVRYWSLAMNGLVYAAYLRWDAQLAAGQYQTAARDIANSQDFLIKNFTRTSAQMEGIALHLAGEPRAESVLQRARVQLEDVLEENPHSGGTAVALCMVMGAQLAEGTEALCRRSQEILNPDAFSMAREGLVQIASGLAMAGATDAAFEQLEEALVSGAGVARAIIELNPMLNSLHDDPRWPDLLSRARP
jgi:TolB-like protein/Flp pilus assembly protein TadD